MAKIPKNLSDKDMIRDYVEEETLEDKFIAAEKEAENARKIAELRESIASLLDNMPALSFSKDAGTGVYLACNQAFADYAHKETPQGVAGLTDYEIFDHATAAHFVEDDRKALAMDKPYVLYEDVADAVGNSRKFQTTKLKFYDPFGRLCLLGMSLDITEMERVKKESEQAQAAYQRALSTSAVYESIINALAEDYFDLYYVDTETDDYIEYGSRTETGHRMTELHGADFFASTRRNVPEFIFEEDQPGFLRAIDKENLLGEIRKHGFYVYYYRLMVDDAPTYVSMKATSISGDDRHIIIGINNVDSQIRDRRAVEQAKETRRAYGRLNALNNNLIVLYIVDAETDQYTEFSATRDYEELGIEKQGEDFFGTTFKNSLRTVHPEDQAMFHSLVTRDGVLKSIEQD